MIQIDEAEKKAETAKQQAAAGTGGADLIDRNEKAMVEARKQFYENGKPTNFFYGKNHTSRKWESTGG